MITVASVGVYVNGKVESGYEILRRRKPKPLESLLQNPGSAFIVI